MATSDDEVRLTVPAMPEYLRLARVTAAGLASRLGFTFDEVEDLRLAIDELCFGLTGSSPRDGTVDIRYILRGDGLVIEGHGNFTGAPAMDASLAGPAGDGAEPAGGGGSPGSDGHVGLSELSEVILHALVDEHELRAGEGGPMFRLVKRRHDAPAP